MDGRFASVRNRQGGPTCDTHFPLSSSFTLSKQSTFIYIKKTEQIHGRSSICAHRCLPCLVRQLHLAQLPSLTGTEAWLPQRPPSFTSAASPTASVPALLSQRWGRVVACVLAHVWRGAWGWRTAGPPMACTEEERREAGGRKDAVTEENSVDRERVGTSVFE